MSTDAAAVVRRWAGDSERWLDAFLKTAAHDSSIISIVAIGSAVRERGHRRSDFDLLVVYQGQRPRLEAPVEVDVRLVGVGLMDEQIAQGHEVLCWALKFGMVLFDRAGLWRNLQQSWGHRLPLPSAARAGERGRQALARARDMLEAEDISAADDLLLAALTQFVRERLIRNGVFPASRPELPDQLREISKDDPLAGLLEDAMRDESSPRDLLNELMTLRF